MSPKRLPAVAMTAVALFLTGLALAPMAAAHHGNEDVGGGDAVWVADGGFMMSLDYELGLTMGYISSSDALAEAMGNPWLESPEAKVHRVIAAVRAHDAVLGQRADALFARFRAIAEYLPGPIAGIADEDLERPLGQGEELVQAARWELSDAGDVTHWIVNATAWKQMDHTEQAGLILHEIFYVLHAIDFHRAERGKLRPRQVRHLVAVISTPWIGRATDSEFAVMLHELDLFAPH